MSWGISEVLLLTHFPSAWHVNVNAIVSFFFPQILWSAWPLVASRDTVVDAQTQLPPILEPVS